MATSYLEDYTRYRTTSSGWDNERTTVSGQGLYSIDDKIGRKDYIKVRTVDEFTDTVSGTEGTVLI